METKEQAKKLLLEFYNAIQIDKSEQSRYRDARLMAIICQSHVANAVIDDWKKYHKESDVFNYLIKNEPETIIN
jgi:phosphoribosylformylglycinamidine (FGAM) synthase PurS component